MDVDLDGALSASFFFFFLFSNYFKVAFMLNGLYETKDVMKEGKEKKGRDFDRRNLSFERMIFLIYFLFKQLYRH